ncbi:hypothetical protein DYB37_007271 [Aphanomyces astaci]|uniref:Arginyl tRNA synthetase N-terminal domain-containing protein n=1 Tax=Aphanomyces astaci TaxID=112090 RepID=A0A3L6VTU8_APHAT|nr:hypothetical protein DYB35_007415 [Aphanomyces astaci]RHZ33362.1 hypothetical protein DYB37_007271 [Aphanomyces astaci]RLO12300.1 hypothetical protein DYB28_000967 [Aphanomyces astaci]
MSLGLPKASVLPTAESIAHEFGLKHAASVASASATKPGFINIKLQDAWIAEHAVHVATHGVKPRRQDHPQHVLVDFASPNMGKGAAIATLLVQALDEPDNSANGLPRSFDPSTSVETLGQWYHPPLYV